MSNANYCACKANGDDLPTVAKIIILYNTPIFTTTILYIMSNDAIHKN